MKEDQIYPWMQHLQSYPNDVMYDSILLMLLSGVRKNEAFKLKWSDVDFEDRSFILRNTKNRTDHELPITTQIETVLKRRLTSRMNDYVFPSNRSNSGHLINISKAVNHTNEQSNLSITVHDLRRTFSMIASRLDFNDYTIKRLINHSTKSDVTSIYLPIDTDDLRKPLQTINDKLNKILINI
ncbi:MAG: tyrosine-type recombinase/integrase [Rickettsiales bacterium]|nr:tyrosine-type recombinase/integrase [Rickettsiales bacterium]